MSGETTLRARLEAIRDREPAGDGGTPTYWDAVAALALLDETSAYAAGTYDVVFTEEGDRYPTRFRLVPDPVVSSIATRDPQP